MSWSSWETLCLINRPTLMLMHLRLILMLIRLSLFNLRMRLILICPLCWSEVTMRQSLIHPSRVLKLLKVSKVNLSLPRSTPLHNRCHQLPAKVQHLWCLKIQLSPTTSMSWRAKRLSSLSLPLRSTFTLLKLKTWLKMTLSISLLQSSMSLKLW